VNCIFIIFWELISAIYIMGLFRNSPTPSSYPRCKLWPQSPRTSTTARKSPRVGWGGHLENSYVDILERFLSKTLHMIVDAPWYVPGTCRSDIRRDLQIPTVKEEIQRYSSQYSARLSAHSNDLIPNLMELPDSRRLRRHLPDNLSTRFLV
jgi:hypothetical protein